MSHGTAKSIGYFLLAGVVVCVLWLLLAGDAAAKSYESVGVREAHRTVVRAQRALREAKAIEQGTKEYTNLYGKDVGRWVWLAHDVGWTRSTWGTLFMVICRESGGSPKAKNPSSTASGLLQFLAFHWDGTGDYGWSFDPFDPRENLRYGHKLYEKQGWAPWALTAQ